MKTSLRFSLLLATGFVASLPLPALDLLWRDGFEGFNLQLRWDDDEQVQVREVEGTIHALRRNGS